MLTLLPPRFPGIETTRAPFGGLSEVILIFRKFGAGEGARTLDPDLGKVVLMVSPTFPNVPRVPKPLIL
jgi:hypothetical protein